jgi:hypothetical protein
MDLESLEQTFVVNVEVKRSGARVLLYNQAFSGDRDALREDSPKLSGWTTFGLRVGLA